MNSKPEFIKRDSMISDTDFVKWLSDVKQRYRQSQIKAVIRINKTMLEFYWKLGRDIVVLKAESKWGCGILKQLSIDLQNMFSNDKGFSYTNIKYMKQWYLFYLERVSNRHQDGGKLNIINRQQLGGEFVQLSDAELELEEALVSNITRFLLELGQGFAYVGRQMELRMDDDTAFFTDLVFYHIPQKRYVIIELKAVKFAPEFAGKLNFYVTAADNLLRSDGDNPSVGILICKTAKKTVVEWSLKDIQKPLGIATYQLEEVVERTIKEIELKKKQIL